MAINPKKRPHHKKPKGPRYTPQPWNPTHNPGGTWSPESGPHHPSTKPQNPWFPQAPTPTHDWDGKPVRLAGTRAKRDLSIGRRRRGGNSGVSKGSSSK
jgi:hypothetical protein